MDRVEYALNLVTEEACEVGQAAAKIARFGFDSPDPDTGVLNREALVKEINDLQGALSVLQHAMELSGAGKLVDLNNPAAIQAKIDKIATYSHFSRSSGTLTEPLMHAAP